VGTGNLTDTPITTAPDVGLFDSAQGFVERWEIGGDEPLSTGFFVVTGITLVPELSTALLLASGLAALAVGRRRRAQ
jgi:hypothetical protein